MAELLSQEEIDALLSAATDNDSNDTVEQQSELGQQEIDALSEVANISMGAASTTLYTILGQSVIISTEKIEVCTWKDVINPIPDNYIGIRTEFSDGLKGTNLLVLKENDVKIITDIMMGGEGAVSEGDITELQISAIGEAMNQMTGASATALAAIVGKRVDISPPDVFKTNFKENDFKDFDLDEIIVKISFKLEIATLINSEIHQFMPVQVAKDLVNGLIGSMTGMGTTAEEPKPSAHTTEQPSNNQEPMNQDYNQFQSNEQVAASQQMPPMYQQDPYQQMPPMYQQQAQNNYPPPQMPYQQMPNPGMQGGYPPQYYQNPQMPSNPAYLPSGVQHGAVSIQPIQYQSFDEGRGTSQKENINLLMDVPLQVTVELGRTHKLIKEILEFSPGSIIELDKLAGELVDILVNGKIIAKGEVVIIDESFGVKVTDIVQPSKRL